MSPDVLARLRKEAEQPAGIAPVIDSPELQRLLAIADDSTAALREVVRILDAAGGPPVLCRAVELGQLSWMAKLSNALRMAEHALAQADADP